MTAGEHLTAARTALSLFERLPHDRNCVVLVTSAVAREGKSFVSQQLAAQLVDICSHTVALVSANISTGRPSTPHDDAPSTLAELVAQGQLPEAAEGKCIAPRLLHIPFGSNSDRTLLFRSGAVERAFNTLRERYRITVVDGSSAADCGALPAHADAVVLVVDSRRTPPHVVKRELARAGLTPARITGAILNYAPRNIPAWLGGD